MVKFLEALLVIKPNIQKEVLMHYLGKCRELHAIAFFQWRNKFPRYTYVHTEQENLIVEKYEWLYHKRLTGQVPTYDTVIYSELPPHFMEKYGSIFSQDDVPHLIQSFHQIGMCDPFNNDVNTV